MTKPIAQTVSILPQLTLRRLWVLQSAVTGAIRRKFRTLSCKKGYVHSLALMQMPFHQARAFELRMFRNRPLEAFSRVEVVHGAAAFQQRQPVTFTCCLERNSTKQFAPSKAKQ